jgi:hypothetical protein
MGTCCMPNPVIVNQHTRMQLCKIVERRISKLPDPLLYFKRSSIIHARATADRFASPQPIAAVHVVFSLKFESEPGIRLGFFGSWQPGDLEFLSQISDLFCLMYISIGLKWLQRCIRRGNFVSSLASYWYFKLYHSFVCRKPGNVVMQNLPLPFILNPSVPRLLRCA